MTLKTSYSHKFKGLSRISIPGLMQIGALLSGLALAGCNDKAAEQVKPGRPVLVATVHYEAQAPERNFVGTVRPRIEADMGFRVAGKVAKRLVEVGQRVTAGQPLAMLDESRSQAPGRAGGCGVPCSNRGRRAGGGRRNSRQGVAHQGLVDRRTVRSEQRRCR